MILSQEEQKELMHVYDTWWHSYLNGDVKTYDSYLADDYRFVGSTDGEGYLNREDTTKFFELTADQLAGVTKLKNLKRDIKELEGDIIIITDLADAYVLYNSEWVYYSGFRFTSMMRKGREGWRFIYQHFSAPDSKAQEGETLGTEQITKENQELRDAIKRRTKELESTLNDLRSTQAQLIHAEKMASLGELTAGIAHEIQNPLNFVNNFSEVSTELIDEMNEEIENGDLNEVKTISSDIKQNLEKITHHGQRASSIVKGMLEHSKVGSGETQLTDINDLCDEYLRLAFHGMKAKDQNFNTKYESLFDESLPKINVVPQDIGRVILNLINNAFQATQDLTGFNAKKHQAHKDEANSPKHSDTSNLLGLAPMVVVTTKNLGSKIKISVADNGPGIPDDIKDKIFQPFFTTKPTGQGTGLGLSLSYDIVKAHGGEIVVESGKDAGSRFIVYLPTKKIQ